MISDYDSHSEGTSTDAECIILPVLKGFYNWLKGMNKQSKLTKSDW